MGTTTTTTTTTVCDGCNCPMDINLDPDGITDAIEYVVTSPNYPDKYPNNADCKWKFINVAGGDLKTVISDLNTESSGTCTKKDFLMLTKMKKYGKVTMCGSSIPNKYKKMTSNGSTLTIKFGSNGSTIIPGGTIKRIPT